MIKRVQVQKNHEANVFRTISICYIDEAAVAPTIRFIVASVRPLVRRVGRLLCLCFCQKLLYSTAEKLYDVLLLFIIIIMFLPSLTVFYFEQRLRLMDYRFIIYKSIQNIMLLPLCYFNDRNPKSAGF